MYTLDRSGNVVPCPSACESDRGRLVGRMGPSAATAFVGLFVVFGIAYSFGAFFDSMAEEFGTGKGATALMFSITTAGYFGLGVFVRAGGRPLWPAAADAPRCGDARRRPAGDVARVESIWVGYATYGSGVGVAVACVYVPMVATVGGWFVRQRTATLGIAVAGIGVGTLVLAPLSGRLIDAQGWRTAYVVLGVGGAAVLLLASVGARRPPVDLARHGRARAERPRPRVRDPLRLDRAAVVGAVRALRLHQDIRHGRGHRCRPSGGTGRHHRRQQRGRPARLAALGSRFDATGLMQLSFATMAASFAIWLVAGDRYAVLVVFAIVMGVSYGGFMASRTGSHGRPVRHRRARRRPRRAVHRRRARRARRPAVRGAVIDSTWVRDGHRGLDDALGCGGGGAADVPGRHRHNDLEGGRLRWTCQFRA